MEGKRSRKTFAAVTVALLPVPVSLEDRVGVEEWLLVMAAGSIPSKPVKTWPIRLRSLANKVSAVKIT